MHRALPTGRRRTTNHYESKPGRSSHDDNNGEASLHEFITSKIATTTNVKTIAPHTLGVTCFELPLRGESLAARLNS